jgi:threonine dehydratase
MKIVIEPSAAVVLAALLEKKVQPEGMRIGLIFSGGNIDLKKLHF